MAVLRDLTTGKRHRINVCHYCDHQRYPRGKPKLDDDPNGQLQPDGSYKCGPCRDQETKKLLSMFGGASGGWHREDA